MIRSTIPIKLDVSRIRPMQPIMVKQFDSESRFIKATILSNGAKIDVPLNSTVLMNVYRKDDQKSTYIGSVNEDGTVTVKVPSWLMAVDGTSTCSITIIDADERKLTTLGFNITVETAEYTGEDIPPEEVDLIVQLISQVSEINGVAIEAKNEAKGYKEFIEDYAEAFSVFEIYNPSKQYVEGNKVSHNGSSYYCIKDSLGNAPTNTTHWLLIAEKGDTGATGADGYTPVKGTDYFTDADKSELVAAALAEIPVVGSEGY